MDVVWVEAAVDAIRRDPDADQDGLLAALGGCGLTPAEAWRAYQFLPIAYVHVAFRGVGFQPGYETIDWDTGERRRHRLADEPVYAAGVASAERRLAAGGAVADLVPVAARSAEFDAVLAVAEPGGDWADIVLSEPVLAVRPG